MSSKYKDLLKNGWHPEKASGSSGSSGSSSERSRLGGGSSIRGQVKGQMNGLLGRNNSEEERTNHVSVPISQLRDPASFAPPPKRTASGLAPPPPPPTASGTRKVLAAPSKYQDPRAPPVQQPVYQKQLTSGEQPDSQEDEHQPPRPYRVNTSGLSTDNLPPPPGRRDGADGRSPPPPPYQSAVGAAAKPGLPGPPSLPPRLPPRTNSMSPASTGNGQNLLNQGAINRLGAAGVSVPALGIGRSNQSSPSPPPPPRPTPGAPSHMDELQNRFSKLGTGGSASTTTPPPPSEGTTWAQKQSALRTASSFHKDPSSVSFSDAKTAASTVNNFRQRHGEQVSAGLKTANGLNQKYGVMDKVGSYVGGAQTQAAPAPAPAPSPSPSPSPSLAGIAGKKKPPPPPPKKKPALGGVPTAAAADDGPPPIPMATRPQF